MRVVVFLTCKSKGFPFVVLLKVMLTPSGTGLASMFSSVIGRSVGMVMVTVKDWLTPGLKLSESSCGCRNKATAFSGLVLQ